MSGNLESLNWLVDKISAASKKNNFITYPPLTEANRLRKEHEINLWKTWKGGGYKPVDLDPLLKSFAPILQERVNRYKRSEVPTSTIMQEHKKQLVNALKKWDPNKGTMLSTWVYKNLTKASRFVETNKNPARIPENINKHIGSYNAVKAELADKLGYAPDVNAIHDFVLTTKHPRLGSLSIRDIKRLEKDQRKTMIEKSYDTDTISPFMSSRSEEVAYLIIPQLTPHEKAVHELTLGLNGKPMLKPGQIAKKLKLDSSKVSKLRTSIYKKMKPYLG